ADAIVCVAEEAREDLVVNFGVPRERSVVIHNPIDLDAVRAGGREPSPLPWDRSRPVIVAAGRLERQKRFDRLLGAVKRLREPARVAILGEGPQRAALEARARELGVEAWFGGFLANPWAAMARAD